MNNNPLKQYFRRPAVYFKLPSGGKDYVDGMIELPETGEIPVYPMTAIDEITTRTPDALFNGTALIEIVKSCVPAIKDPWKISSNDMDAILIAIKVASSGDVLEVETTCPSCSETNTYGVNLIPILNTLKPGNYDNTLNVGDLTIKFNPLTYKEMNDAALANFELQRTFVNIENAESEEERNKITKDTLEKITVLTMNLLTQTIEYIQTSSVRVDQKEFILDYLKNCDRNVYNKIRDYNGELKAATEIKPLHITCDGCGNEYDQPFTLSPVDFFE
jgi:hypothetical protein